MEKYLYLTKREWATTWIKGGKIPIALASSYLSDNRSGTFTPDENLIHESPVDLTGLSPFFEMDPGVNIKGLTIQNNSWNGVLQPEVYNANYYHEDGLILSFCNSFSEKIAQRLGKQACVKIRNIKSLKRIIDEQLKVKGIADCCRYTTDHQRNHFLKSVEDAWQDEYRIFWPLTTSRMVGLPKGVAVFVAEF